jgi:hypothetical protein
MDTIWNDILKKKIHLFRYEARALGDAVISVLFGQLG